MSVLTTMTKTTVKPTMSPKALSLAAKTSAKAFKDGFRSFKRSLPRPARPLKPMRLLRFLNDAMQATKSARVEKTLYTTSTTTKRLVTIEPSQWPQELQQIPFADSGNTPAPEGCVWLPPLAGDAYKSHGLASVVYDTKSSPASVFSFAFVEAATVDFVERMSRAVPAAVTTFLADE